MWNVKLEWCSVSQLLCWHHVTDDNGITQKIMSLSHLLPSRSTLIPPPPSSRVDFQLLIYPFIVVSFNPNIFYLASYQQLGRQHQSHILNITFTFFPVCVCIIFTRWPVNVLVLSCWVRSASSPGNLITAFQFCTHSLHLININEPTAENEKALIRFFSPYVAPALSAADAPH